MVFTDYIVHSWAMPFDRKQHRRPVLDIAPTAPVDGVNVDIQIGKKRNGNWDVVVHMAGDEYLKPQLLGRNISNSSEALVSKSHIKNVTPDSKEFFEGQPHIERHHTESLKALRRVHLNNVPDKVLPDVMDNIFTQLKMTSADITEANTAVKDHRDAASDAEKMAGQNGGLAIVRNFLNHLSRSMTRSGVFFYDQKLADPSTPRGSRAIDLARDLSSPSVI